MPPKLRHQCERCGLVADFERAGRFRDQDFYELLQEYFELEHEHILTLYSLAGAREGRDRLRARLDALAAPVPEIAADDEDPFNG